MVVSSLLAGSHQDRGCYADFYEIKVIKSLTQLWILKATLMAVKTRCAHQFNSGTSVIGTTNWSWIRFET